MNDNGKIVDEEFATSVLSAKNITGSLSGMLLHDQQCSLLFKKTVIGSQHPYYIVNTRSHVFLFWTP